MLPFGALNLTPVRTRRSQPNPAARYTHPKALEAPAANGAHDHGLDVLAENAPNYLRWIADTIEPYLGNKVLDLGAGIGSVTAHYVPGREVVACDRSSTCVDAMRHRFRDAPNVTVIQGDLTELSDLGARFESVVMLNVLEHIEDDVGVLASLQALLEPAGRIIIYVPALNALYGKMDRKLGHYRRYSKWRFNEIARDAGLEIVTLSYMNALAIPGWLAFSRSDTDRTYGPSLAAWDRTGVRLSRAIEGRIRAPVGLNLLAVLSSPR